jgi:hypothetical protein
MSATKAFQWVRVMADYSSDGLWAYDGVMMMREDLPISPLLAARHERWCMLYESYDYDTPDDDPAMFDITGFAAEGLLIAKAIKAELPDWTVVYFDVEKCDYDNLAQPRDEVEYEVT